MGTDPDNADQSDWSNEQFDPEFAREILADLLNPSSDVTDEAVMRGVFDKIIERGDLTPPTTDEEGNPLPRLDVDDPPAEPPEDPLLRVGYALLAHLPEDWESASLEITGAADDVRTLVTVRELGDSPSVINIHFFTDLTEPCLALRQSAYEPGRGAWYDAMIELFRDGTIHPTYNYIAPPFGVWGSREVDLVLRDHEIYPRDPEQLPPWHPAVAQSWD